MFLGVMTSPTERPHLLCHTGLDAEAGHFRACEPLLAEVGSQAPALHAGVHDFRLWFFRTPYYPSYYHRSHTYSFIYSSRYWFPGRWNNISEPAK